VLDIAILSVHRVYPAIYYPSHVVVSNIPGQSVIVKNSVRLPTIHPHRLTGLLGLAQPGMPLSNKGLRIKDGLTPKVY
jgi:hypothetical protein